jgi:flagellar biosynthesis protein FliP
MPIEIIVSTIVMSMGMMMLPPTVISLPFKVLFFILIDGWNLLVSGFEAPAQLGDHEGGDQDAQVDLLAGLGLGEGAARQVREGLKVLRAHFYVMAPTFDRAWNEGVKPLQENRISEEEAFGKIVDPQEADFEAPAQLGDHEGGDQDAQVDLLAGLGLGEGGTRA